MIRTLYRHKSGTIVVDLPCDQLATAARDGQGRLWIDMQDASPEEFKLVLEDTFRFHPLSIEDAITDVHVPKLDDYSSYLYLVFHTIRMGEERMDIDTFEMDVFLGPNYLITMHDDVRPSIEKFRDIDHHRQLGLARGPSFLLYELLDKQIDTYIPLLDQFAVRLEELGDSVFQTDPKEENVLLNDLLTAKSSALRVRRVLAPQRDLLNRLAVVDYAVIPPEMRIYFRDVYDHLVRLSDLVDSSVDLASVTIDTHLAVVNNRMNSVMKVLTIISTIFIPLSFIAGVYGMNFEFMPELRQPWAYPLMWLIFLSVGGGMLWMFYRRKWL